MRRCRFATPLAPRCAEMVSDPNTVGRFTDMSSSIDSLVNREYQYGFVTDVEADTLPPGVSEDVIRLISKKKDEPQWLLDWRLKAYRRWLTMKEPHWPNVT